MKFMTMIKINRLAHYTELHPPPIFVYEVNRHARRVDISHVKPEQLGNVASVCIHQSSSFRISRPRTHDLLSSSSRSSPNSTRTSHRTANNNTVSPNKQPDNRDPSSPPAAAAGGLAGNTSAAAAAAAGRSNPGLAAGMTFSVRCLFRERVSLY
ncbi:hypothetical protein BU25DRAFT_50960 [Macroventuria anomochaeta]|uniref:Uncharacterized protein n=1 Tax=Macroventuria anomochaeta TaxID=301207 RepID=A0ACB6S0Q6_9PLEO|nr:uncharacterized protein BU25DRAFT_50960 [Macroventuria anomochaeta]KAF2627619.1 hypothetical protein BU25DRAFT_50960 [Macroventuria anomochaeta]